MTDLADRILEHIGLNGPSKAKEIADALGVDRSAVNYALYGPLRGKLRQGNDYKWSLNNVIRTRSSTPAAVNSHGNVFQYYLDCLSQDDDSGVSVFADSKYDL